jgi:class 3 adenylate cyclase/tetratricopeptide (TPR) repeat protein
MDFESLLDEACELLRRRQRMTHGALRRQLGIDEAVYADLKLELIAGRRVAAEEDGVVMVWASAEAAEPQPPASAAASRAERRQVTVLYCDLAGSTELSNRLAAEDLHGVLQAFRAAVQAQVELHGGQIHAFHGDGVAAVFGYPQAREDAARRAARAGLSVPAALAPLVVSGHALRARIGIATGLVIVDESVTGRSAAREEGLIGPTIALAARMQSLARHGEVVILHTTQRLLGPRFDCADLGAVSLPGLAEPLQTWRLNGERNAEQAALESAHAPRPPLVGRELEWPVLQDSWQQAHGGQGRVVTLVGDAGMGKSRLCEALCEHLASRPHRLLRGFCQSHFESTALQPVVQQLAHAAGMADDEADAARLARLQALLRLNLPPERQEPDLPYLAALLSIPAAGGWAPLADSPEKQREKTLEVLLAMVRHIAQSQPVLMVFEDLHWADPTTLELLLRLVREAQTQRILLLVTARPGFEPPWAELPHAVRVDLTPLRRHDRAAIVAFHAAARPLPESVVEQIVTRGEGNPLWVEELTKSALESAAAGARASVAAVPRSLQDSLQSRLDRLGEAKELAQVGAALGRQFSHGLLETVVGWPAARLRHGLQQLVESGLLSLRGLPPQAVYAFKHALIQDAAYDTMLRERRRTLHHRIAEVLERDPASAREPERLARHLVEAGQPERAVPFLLQAGLRAVRAGARVEAGQHFDAGLKLLEELPEGQARMALELPLRLHLGETLAATRGYAAPEVSELQERARELCRLLGNTGDLFWVLDGLCVYRTVLSQQAVARELADDMNELADRLGRPEYQVEAAVMEAWTYGSTGHLQRAHDAMARAVACFHRADPAYAYPTPQLPLVSALSWQSALALVLGDDARSHSLVEELRRTIDKLAKPFDSAFALTWIAMDHNLRGEPQQALQEAGRALDLAQRFGYPVWLAAAGMQTAVAYVGLGRVAEGIALLEPTIAAYRASGAELNSCYFLSELAGAFMKLGRMDDARRVVAEALAGTERSGERWQDAVLHRLRAELLVEQGTDLPAAWDAFEHALSIARQQGARLFELRAAHRMARLAQGHASAQLRARAALEPTLLNCLGLQALPEYRQAQQALAALAA